MTKSTIHPYIPNSVPKIKREMMDEIGVRSIEELYADIHKKFRLKRRLNLPNPSSEYEVKRHIEGILSKNKACKDMPVFLGAGCWPHYVPALVGTIIERSEFLTSYTPYQAEVSQGMLQALFEYQSMICEITGMDVANIAMFDWASALSEAALMAARVTHRKEVIIPKIIHPERLATMQTYVEPAGITIRQVGYNAESGQLDLEDLREKDVRKAAAVYIENPTYLGFLETQVEEIADTVHRNEALFIVGVDPISLGILKAPGEYGADIVVGEGQPLGNHMSYGGPLLGIFACLEDMKLIRQMPGRIIGLTTTKDEKQVAFCMALTTREQHIRRERATSNICTTEALCAVAAAVYLALLGPQGLKELGECIMYKSHYAMKSLDAIEGVKAPVFKSNHFKEFTVNFNEIGKTVRDVHKKLLDQGVHGGKDITNEFPELGQTALYCVTEIHSKEEIDRLIRTLMGFLGR